MTPEERFSNFFSALKKDSPIWFDSLPMIYPNKDIPMAIKKVWLTLHGEGKMKAPIDWVYARNLIQKTLTWQEPKNNEVYVEAKPVLDHPDALTGEARAKRIAEYLDAIAKVGQPERVKGNKIFHVAQQIQKPDVVYHPPSKKEVYEKDRHLAWIRHCFDPKTAEANENWISENEFDQLYDNGLI